jgi:hypothetical protein
MPMIGDEYHKRTEYSSYKRYMYVICISYVCYTYIIRISYSCYFNGGLHMNLSLLLFCARHSSRLRPVRSGTCPSAVRRASEQGFGGQARFRSNT